MTPARASSHWVGLYPIKLMKYKITENNTQDLTPFVSCKTPLNDILCDGGNLIKLSFVGYRAVPYGSLGQCSTSYLF